MALLYHYAALYSSSANPELGYFGGALMPNQCEKRHVRWRKYYDQQVSVLCIKGL